MSLVTLLSGIVRDIIRIDGLLLVSGTDKIMISAGGDFIKISR